MWLQIKALFYAFNTKSGTTNERQLGSSDMSNKSPLTRDSIDITNFPKNFLCQEKFKFTGVRQTEFLAVQAPTLFLLWFLLNQTWWSN